MNRLLQGVVNGPDGTGRLARVGDFAVAGKTGTAQMVNPATGAYYQSRLVASFVGFVPADDPRLVILVVLYDVSHGHFGGLTAAPVFSEIAAGALSDMNVTPSRPHYETASLLPFAPAEGAALKDGAGDDSVNNSSAMDDESIAAALSGDGAVPDFVGLSLRRAVALAGRRHLNLEIKGDGYVVAQQPAPGALPHAGSVNLHLAPMVANADSKASLRQSSMHGLLAAPGQPPGPAPRHAHRRRGR
jgi:cell division protein FtsI (penicillin-binding protein 3)